MKDRVVLITNVEHFVGRPVAAELVAQGATVVCHDRSFADAARAHAFAAANPALAVVRAQGPAEIVAAATEACGRIDTVVCNDAGAALRAPIEAARADDLRAALEEMVVFPFEMASAVVPQMKARKSGKILFITSATPLRGLPNYSMYVAARGATNALTVSLAQELGRDNIQVNADAAKLYRNYQENNPDSVSFQQALERIESGQPATALVTESRTGAAEALFGVANALFQENALEPALIYARISIYLRRNSDASHLFLGQVLESLGRPQQAIDAYRSVSRSSPLFWSARLRVATSLDSLDRTDEALKELSAMASERAERADALITIGDLLRSKQRWTEAASAYDRAFNRIESLERRHWRPLYARGISLERSQQWDRAEADFLKALELEPNQPFVLNYLGYSWVDQGTHLQRALKMIERAVDLRPNDGYIIDSLGWALFRLGEFEDAATHLERAVELRPDDPTINDHLGDAYWRVGRQVEARFQWSRALVLEPEEDQISGIESKIANGLGTDPQREGNI